MKGYNVHLNKVLIDKVFYDDSASIEYIKNDLITREHHDTQIVITEMEQIEAERLYNYLH